MPQHRPIALIKDVSPDMNTAIRVDPHDVHIVRAMMDFAEGKPVRNFWAPPHIPVLENMRRVQQLRMVQAAHGAALPICRDNQLAEAVLVQPALHSRRRIGFEQASAAILKVSPCGLSSTM
jgi:hypothetical protein